MRSDAVVTNAARGAITGDGWGDGTCGNPEEDRCMQKLVQIEQDILASEPRSSLAEKPVKDVGIPSFRDTLLYVHLAIIIGICSERLACEVLP